MLDDKQINDLIMRAVSQASKSFNHDRPDNACRLVFTKMVQPVKDELVTITHILGDLDAQLKNIQACLTRQAAELKGFEKRLELVEQYQRGQKKLVATAWAGISLFGAQIVWRVFEYVKNYVHFGSHPQ